MSLFMMKNNEHSILEKYRLYKSFEQLKLGLTLFVNININNINIKVLNLFEPDT